MLSRLGVSPERTLADFSEPASDGRSCVRLAATASHLGAETILREAQTPCSLGDRKADADASDGAGFRRLKQVFNDERTLAAGARSSLR